MHTIPSPPSSARAEKASLNAPGEGAEVSGNSATWADLSQNSSGDQVEVISGPNAPSRTSRCTTLTPCSAATALSRPGALSETTRTRVVTDSAADLDRAVA